METQLVHVQRQILLADLVERAYDPTLHDRPESFEGVGMHRTDHILALDMIPDLVRIQLTQLPVAPSTDR